MNIETYIVFGLVVAAGLGYLIVRVADGMYARARSRLFLPKGKGKDQTRQFG